MGILVSQASAQNLRKEATCTPSGKPARYETNNFDDLGWWVDDCDIARLSKNTPTRDADDNLVTGTRICRWQNPDGLCYEFSHDGTTGEAPLFLRTRPEFDSSMRMAQRTTEPAFDVCLVNWQWVDPTDPDYIPETPRPTACGVHQITEGDVCQEILSTPASAGFSYCNSKCALLQRGPDQAMEIDNGACVPNYQPPDLSFLSNPCWPFGCTPGQPVHPPPPPPPPPVNNPPVDPPLCPPGTTDPICVAYQTVFGEEDPDKAGYQFWEDHLVNNPVDNPDDLTEDPDFLNTFQNGCGVNHCAVLCSDPANAHLHACQPDLNT